MRYALAAFCILLVLLTIVLGGSAQTTGWPAIGQRYRLPVTVAAGANEYTDKVVETPVNFTASLTALGAAGSFNENSVVVTETDAQGSIIDQSVMYQFDRAADYNASSAAKGTLLILAKGATAAGATRRFHVYFDTATNFTRPTFTPLVSIEDNVQNAGAASIKITTPNGIYFYDKPGAGIASIIDANGKDWITHGTAGGSAGMYRGIPNVIEPEGGFHAGDTRMTSTIGASGPLKFTVSATSNDNLWAGFYEFFPRYAKFTLTKTGHAYWYLYEGTPGGVLDLSTDYNVLSNGTKTMASQSWNAAIPSPQWIYFADGTLDRSLFMYNLNDDTKGDQYWPMDGGNMTVFGFGRPGPNMDVLPGRLVFGLMNTRDHAAAKKLIEGAGGSPATTAGTAEKNDGGPSTGPTATTTPSGCTKKAQGDADCNGTVSVTDYAVWRTEYKGGCSSTNLTAAACGDDKDVDGSLMDADFGGDNKVSLADYQAWRNNIQ